MKESTGKMISGIIIGAIAGAAAGLLFAPDKGSVTRKKISDKAKETGGSIKDSVSGKFEQVKDYVTETVDKMKKKTNHDGSAEYHEEAADSRTKG